MRGLTHILIGVVFLITPFFISFNTGDTLRIAKLKITLLIGVSLFAFWLIKRVGIGLSAFYYVSAVSAVYVGLGANQVHPLLFMTFAYMICASGFKLSSKQLSFVLLMICISGFLCASYAYFQMAGVDPLMNYYDGQDPTKPTALFGQHTLYGPWIVACLIAAIYSRYYIFLAFMLPTVIATNSALTLLALFGALFFYFSRFISYKISIGICIILLIGLVIGLAYFSKREQFFSANGRYTVWKESIEMTEDKQIFGHGIGTFRYLYHKYKQSKESKELHGVFLQAHSDPVEVYFELGLIGVLSLILVLYDFIRGLLIKTDIETWAFAAIAVCFFLNSFGNFPFQVMPHALLVLFSIMIVTRKVGNEHEQTNRFIYA